jgi:hypothetical protein
MGFINDILITDSLMLLGRGSAESSGIYDDFSGATFNSFWQSGFKTNWSLTHYPPASSSYTAVRGSSSVDNLTSNSVPIGGDFSVEVGFITGANNTGNVSCKLEFFNYTIQTQKEIVAKINGTDLSIERYGHTQVDQSVGSFSAYTEYKIKVERIGSTTNYYYDIGAGYVSWFSETSSYTGDVFFKVEGADLHGISFLNMTAEYGLPTVSSTGDFSAHRLDREVANQADLIEMWDGLSSL